MPLFRRTLLSALLFAVALSAIAQRHSVSGYVTDSATGEALIGATVFIQELNKGVPSNNYGYYSATLEAGTYTLVFESVKPALRNLHCPA